MTIGSYTAMVMVGNLSLCHARPPSTARTWLLPSVITAACLLVAVAHWPALSAKALSFDDGFYVIENPLVLHPSWDSARRFVGEMLEPSTVPGYYQPLSMISLMLDVAMGGSPENLRPFHRTSLILHVLNTALVILILHRLFKRPVVAAAVGLLFGAHPLTVEPIPWLGERKTLLAAFFALACILAYLRYAERPRWKSYTTALVLFMLALLAKPTCTPLPVVLLLMDGWPLNRLNRRAILEKVPFLIIAAVFAVITFVSQDRTAFTAPPDAGPPNRVPFVLCHNIIYYLYEIVWPRRLTSHYLLPEPLNLSNRYILAGVIGTCILIPLLLVSLRWTRALMTGWLIFFVAIFPTMGVVGFTNVIASDKYAYLPSIGLLMIVAWALGRCVDAVNRRAIPSYGKFTLCGSVLVLAGLEMLGTRRQLALWQNSETLVRYMLDLEPRSGILYNRLGGAMEEAGKKDEALAYYEKSVRLMPGNAYARNSLALMLSSQGRDREAMEQYEAALLAKPVPYEVHHNYALLLVKQERAKEAMVHFQEALRLRADFTEAHVNLGNLLADGGQFAEAAEHYRAALKSRPKSANLHNNLGSALRGMGQVDEAIVEFERALAIDPRYVSSMINLANALRQKGRLDEAIERYRAAIAVDPAQGAAHFNLGTALFEERRYSEAEAALREAIRLLPNNAEVHFYLGRVIEEQGRKEDAAAEYRETLRLNPNHAGAKGTMK